MDDVKDDPCVGFLLVAHCCHFLSRTDMTNSRSVAHSDVDISSWVELLHHFPREILEEFGLVGAIAKKFRPVPWNPHVLEGNTSAVNDMIAVYLTGRVILPWPLGTTGMSLFCPSSMVVRAWNNDIAVPWKIFCRGCWRCIVIYIVGIFNGE